MKYLEENKLTQAPKTETIDVKPSQNDDIIYKIKVDDPKKDMIDALQEYYTYPPFPAVC